MSFTSIIKEKQARLESVPDAFLTQVQKAEKKAFSELLKILGTLKTDADGILLPGQLGKIEEIANVLKNSFFQGDYIKAVQEFAGEFYKQKELTQAYYKVFGSFTDSELYEQTFKASLNNAIDLLNGNSVDQQLVNPVKKILTQSLTTKTDYSSMIKTLSETIQGIEGSGTLSQYLGGVARDAFAVTDRTYTQIINEDIGYEWYLYAGGLLKSSRQFCIDKEGGYFHISEIQSWASEDWQGKNEDTTEGTIMVLVGGHNCIHSLLPVPTDEVPQTDLDRML